SLPCVLSFPLCSRSTQLVTQQDLPGASMELRCPRRVYFSHMAEFVKSSSQNKPARSGQQTASGRCVIPGFAIHVCPNRAKLRKEVALLLVCRQPRSKFILAARRRINNN